MLISHSDNIPEDTCFFFTFHYRDTLYFNAALYLISYTAHSNNFLVLNCEEST